MCLSCNIYAVCKCLSDMDNWPARPGLTYGIEMQTESAGFTSPSPPEKLTKTRQRSESSVPIGCSDGQKTEPVLLQSQGLQVRARAQPYDDGMILDNRRATSSGVVRHFGLYRVSGLHSTKPASDSNGRLARNKRGVGS